MVLRVDGIYDIEGKPSVVLEALPVNIGTNANNPGKRFFAHPISEYNRLKELRFMTESPTDGFNSLQNAFPDVAGKVLDNIRDDGNVNCRFTLKNGEVHTYGYANFATLPFGIYSTVGDDRTPRLSPLDSLASLEVIED